MESRDVFQESLIVALVPVPFMFHKSFTKFLQQDCKNSIFPKETTTLLRVEKAKELRMRNTRTMPPNVLRVLDPGKSGRGKDLAAL